MIDNIWMNWSRSAICRPARIEEPGSEEEILDLVQNIGSSSTVRVAGSGHSFTRIVESNDYLINLENYTGVKPENDSVRVRAGTSLEELGKKLYSQGKALENLGDINKQSLAGALATGTHGTGKQFGVLSTQATEFKIVTPGGVVECSRDKNTDVFRAAQVSLGALGVVSEITLRTEPSYRLELKKSTEDVNEVISNADTYAENNRNFEFFWFPYTDTAVVKRLNKTKDPTHGSTGGFDEILENKVWSLLCRISNLAPATSKHMSRLAAATISDEEVVGASHEVFPSLRDVRFNEMEYSVPAEEGEDVFQSIQEIAEQHDVQFPVEYRYVAGDDIPLSPAYGRDSVYIAVHKYYRKPYEDFFQECEEIFRDHGGRPHWGKHHYLDSTILRDLYPEWSLFMDVRERLDPEGVFINEYLERVLGV